MLSKVLCRVKLAALGAQHFIDTLLHDTYQVCMGLRRSNHAMFFSTLTLQANRRRQASEGKKSSRAPVLQTADLAAALQEVCKLLQASMVVILARQ